MMGQIIVLAATAGLRSAEVGRVTWADIDRNAGVLHVRLGKGNNDRSVPLSGGLLAELADPGEGRIISSSTGRAMSPTAVSASVGRYLRSEGIDSTTHKLRARYATRLYSATNDLVATAEVLGHASVATTQRYVVASSDTIRKGAEACGRIGCCSPVCRNRRGHIRHRTAGTAAVAPQGPALGLLLGMGPGPALAGARRASLLTTASPSPSARPSQPRGRSGCSPRSASRTASARTRARGGRASLPSKALI
jgi:hypothetical protein